MYRASAVIAGMTPASLAHALAGSGSRKQSSAGEQPIFSRGPTMDGHGNTLPSSHGLQGADDAARHAPGDGAAADDGRLASLVDARLASGALASSGSQPPADVLTVHAAAADPSEDSSTQQSAHAAGSTSLPFDASAQLATAQLGQPAGEAQPPGVAHVPQGILRRSRSWAATMPQEAGSSGSAAGTLHSTPWSPEAAAPADSGRAGSRCLVTELQRGRSCAEQAPLSRTRHLPASSGGAACSGDDFRRPSRTHPLTHCSCYLILLLCVLMLTALQVCGITGCIKLAVSAWHCTLTMHAACRAGASSSDMAAPMTPLQQCSERWLRHSCCIWGAAP
jgi:hypothetical protein